MRTITSQGPTPVGQRLRAQRIQGRRRPVPELSEWDDAPVGDQDEEVAFDLDLMYELRGDR